jgi:hypothetical protein
LDDRNLFLNEFGYVYNVWKKGKKVLEKGIKALEENRTK